MTVTRYKRQPATADAITEAVLGVTRHKRPVPAVPAELAREAKGAPAAGEREARTAPDLVQHHNEVVMAPRQPLKINKVVLARSRRPTHGRGSQGEEMALHNPFQAYKPPPGVLPDKTEPNMALDGALGTWAQESYTNAWNFSNPMGEMFAEGIGFLGYAYLAQLTQRPEYRRISERIATEMTRKWIRLTIAGEADPEETDDEDADEDDLAEDRAPAKKPAKQPDRDLDDEESDDPGAAGPAQEDDEDDEPTPEEIAQRKRNDALLKKLKLIDDDMKRLDVRGNFKSIAEYDGWMGRAHLYIDTGESDDDDELLTDLGNGSDTTSKEKFKKGSLRSLKHIEAMWCYPVNYNANNPLSDEWYNPQIWFAMAKRIHVSRLLTFVGRPVPDILKPSYAFGGLSMSQMAKPYVDNWLRTRQAVTALIESFSVSGVYTNAQSLMQGGGDEVLDRIEMFNANRTNLGSMVLDKDTEEFFNISTPLGTLDHLQAQSQEQMSSVSGIPLIVLLGITPTGLNASSEGELRVFYDLIHAMQESLFRDKLKRVIDFIQLNLFGEVDPAIGFEFEPLWSLDEKGEAEVRKVKAETHQLYVDMGVVSQEEIRKIEIDDDDSPYSGLDPEEMPDPPAEAGMVQGGPGGAGGEGGGSGRADNHEVDGAADEMPIEVAEDVFAFDDGQFDESKHKRDAEGKFATTGASAGGGAENQELSKFKTKKEHIAHLLTKGVTPKQLMNAMGWPSVSMPAQAKSLGMKLEISVVAGQKVYKGIPMTEAEKAEAKTEAKGKETDKQAQQILKNAGLESMAGKPAPKLTEKPAVEAPKVEPKKPMIPPATGEEMKKAKKSTTLSLQLLPAKEKPTIAGSDPMKSIEGEIKSFNDKYAGKEGLSAEQLSEKVHHFKALVAHAEAMAANESKQKAEILAKQKAEAKQKADAAAAKAKEEAARAAEKNKKIISELGISEQQAEGVTELAKMLGSKTGDLVETFKSYAKQAQSYGYPISGFQCALIKNYSNGGYHAINDSLRKGAWTPAQHAYVAMTNKALMAMPKYKGGGLTRGAQLSAEQQQAYVSGHIVQESAFMSTSTGKGFGGNTTFKVTAIGKRGADIQKLSNHPGEKEVLFAARTYFKVNKVEGTPGGSMTIHLEEWEEHV